MNHRDAFLLLQVIGQFAAIMSSTRDESEDLPDPSARLAEVMGTTNLDALMFLPVGCLDNLGSWFYLTLLVKTTAPMIPLLLLWLWALTTDRRGGVHKGKRMQKAAHFSILWIQLILTSVSTAIVQTFVCSKFPDDEYLAVELTVSCSRQKHRLFWRPWAICALLIYPIG